MKQKLCVLLAFVMLMTGVLCGCQGKSGGILSDITHAAPHRFGKDDLTVNGKLMLGMTVDEVKDILGKPISEGCEDGYEDYNKTLQYDGLWLFFFDRDGKRAFKLSNIASTEASDIAQFAFGLHVGSKAEDVIAAFTCDENRRPLYSEMSGEEVGEILYGDYLPGGWYKNDSDKDKPTALIQSACKDVKCEEDEFLPGDELTYYYLKYYYADQAIWNDDGDNLGSYCLQFTVDIESDTVIHINLA